MRTQDGRHSCEINCGFAHVATVRASVAGVEYAICVTGPVGWPRSVECVESAESTESVRQLRLSRQGGEAWRARGDRAAAASARAPPAPCERRRFYGCLRELPAPRAKGTREALGAHRGRAR